MSEETRKVAETVMENKEAIKDVLKSGTGIKQIGVIFGSAVGTAAVIVGVSFAINAVKRKLEPNKPELRIVENEEPELEEAQEVEE